MKAKYQKVAEFIKRRALEGDYALNLPPSERRLAKETGVSYMTARRAVQELFKEEVLIRGENGRLQLNQAYSNLQSSKHIVLITPAWNSPIMHQWRMGLKLAIEKHGGIFKVVTYDHPDDPAIYDALDGEFNHIFIISDNPSDTLKLKISKMPEKIISIACDMSELGVLSVDDVAPDHINDLVLRLKSLGHHDILFFNTQPEGLVIKKRMEIWQTAIKKTGLNGIIINNPVQSFQNASLKAYEVFIDLIKTNQIHFTAVYSSTVPTGVGILRAMYETGLRCPEDLSICSLGERDDAQLSIPAISVIDTSNFNSFIEDIYIHVLNDDIDRDKLHYCHEHKFFEGESIGIATEKTIQKKGEK